jgi:Transcription antiterminator
MTFASEESEYSTEATGQAASPDVPEIDARWYAVQVASGCEKRVKANLQQRIQTLDVADRIVQVKFRKLRRSKSAKTVPGGSQMKKSFPATYSSVCLWTRIPGR